MRIKIDYPVAASGLRRRGTPKTVVFRHSGVFDVPDYSSAELSVAMSVRLERYGRRAETKDYIGIDGRLFAADNADAEVISGAAPRWLHKLEWEGLSKTAAKFPGAGQAWYNANRRVLQTLIDIRREHGTSVGSSIAPEEVAKLVASNIGSLELPLLSKLDLKSIDHEAIAFAEQRMADDVADIVLVDGRVWRAAAEPLYATSSDMLVNVPRLEASTPDMGRTHLQRVTDTQNHGWLKPIMMYRADEYAEAAFDLTERQQAVFGGQFEAVGPIARIEIMDESYLMEDSAETGVLVNARIAQTILAARFIRRRAAVDDRPELDLFMENVEHFDMELITALKRITDGVRRAAIHGVDETLVADLREIADRDETYSYFQRPMIAEQSRAIFEATLRRWEERKIDLGSDLLSIPAPK
jgi:hypothetical protein